MVPADEHALRKASLLEFFNQIEDDITHRIANILEAGWGAIHLLIEDVPFNGKVATYKKALAAFPEKSFSVEKDKIFWRMIDDLRVARNAFAHGTQFFMQSETEPKHVYARAGLALNQKFDQAIDFDAITPANLLATHLHLLLNTIVIEDIQGQEFLFEKARLDWESLKPLLPAGRGAKWPPRRNSEDAQSLV
jgi:hypothetical protein